LLLRDRKSCRSVICTCVVVDGIHEKRGYAQSGNHQDQERNGGFNERKPLVSILHHQ
jgi:hypothetical protein